MALLFAFAAALQLNDPDPIRWIAIYARSVCSVARGVPQAPCLAPAIAIAVAGDRARLGGELLRSAGRPRLNMGTCSTPGR